eukprot:COSAG01_NODE_26852_length_701_cov_1.365449_1_plen_84_part_10
MAARQLVLSDLWQPAQLQRRDLGISEGVPFDQGVARLVAPEVAIRIREEIISQDKAGVADRVDLHHGCPPDTLGDGTAKVDCCR